MRRAVLLALLLLAPGAASANPWSVTLYGGPSTYTIFTQIVDGHARFNGGMIALAADRRLGYLGWGWNLVGEVQIQQFAFGSRHDFIEGSGTYNAVALGLGLEYHHFPWERSLPTAFSVFMGPCYSFDPPLAYQRVDWGSRKSLLNYLAFELAVALPQQRQWDAVVRIYHRSGVWGIYTNDVAEASVVGVGLRYRF